MIKIYQKNAKNYEIILDIDAINTRNNLLLFSVNFQLAIKQ